MHRGGRGDARASCASPLGTPLKSCLDFLDVCMVLRIRDISDPAPTPDDGSCFFVIDLQDVN
jgi:hypothetical protein